MSWVKQIEAVFDFFIRWREALPLPCYDWSRLAKQKTAKRKRQLISGRTAPVSNNPPGAGASESGLAHGTIGECLSYFGPQYWASRQAPSWPPDAFALAASILRISGAYRYASVLADDPGSSVLTLTSLGMAELSRPPGKGVSRTVAMWRDQSIGTVPIDLPAASRGAVLSITREEREEWTADGRSDNRAASSPILTGVHFV